MLIATTLQDFVVTVHCAKSKETVAFVMFALLLLLLSLWRGMRHTIEIGNNGGAVFG